jgi:hypothetical protein
MPTDRTDLLESLEKHNAAFTTLLSLIPSQYYIAPTQEEVRVEHRSAVSQAFHTSVGFTARFWCGHSRAVG